MRIITGLLPAFTLLACFAQQHSHAASAGEPLVERGRHLATAGNCEACHTVPGAAPYTGGVSFTTDFGTLYSTNITQDRSQGIGDWSEAQFRQALKRGIRPNGEHLYPAFPYTAFAKLSDDDISALYAYMQTVEPASTRIPENSLQFPYNQRPLMLAWKWLYHETGPLEARADKSPQWNRGAYLVEALGHCSACHTPRNWLGAEQKEFAYTGSEYLDRVQDGSLRPWFAVDLTDSQQGLSDWSTEQLTRYLKDGINDYATAFGPMNKVIENSTRHLSREDVQAMAVYLKDLPGNSPVGDAAALPASALGKGAALYSVHCATCHLPTGKGSIETGPSLIGNPVVEAANPASLINVILYGPALPKFSLQVQRTQMDGYDSLLTDAEIAALSNYMRSSWGNAATAVSEKQVARQRN